MKSEYIASMAHELRTPLNSIIGFTELMYDGRVGAVSDEHREYLGDILASAKHLLRLINDVLDLARIDSGKRELQAQRIDLSQLVSEVRDLVRAQAAKKQIRIAVDIDPHLGDIVFDPAHLKSVLYCHLSNALAFTPAGGCVTVGAAADAPGMFRLEVDYAQSTPAIAGRFDAILPVNAHLEGRR